MKKRDFIKSIQKRLEPNSTIEIGDIDEITFSEEEEKEIEYWVKHYIRHINRFGLSEKMPEGIVQISKRLRLDFGLCNIPNSKHIIYIIENVK